MELNPIIARLAETRRARGLSLGQVAVRIGCTPASISWWDSGKHEPLFGHVEAYAKAMGLRLVLVPAEAAPQATQEALDA